MLDGRSLEQGTSCSVIVSYGRKSAISDSLTIKHTTKDAAYRNMQMSSPLSAGIPKEMDGMGAILKLTVKNIAKTFRERIFQTILRDSTLLLLFQTIVKSQKDALMMVIARTPLFPFVKTHSALLA